MGAGRCRLGQDRAGTIPGAVETRSESERSRRTAKAPRARLSLVTLYISRSPVFPGVKSPFDDRDTVELYFRDNTELDPINSGCWRWRGPPVKTRRYRKKGGVMRALYQIAFELFRGPVPDRHVVHHTCENIHCVNPEHLKALTPREHNKLHLSDKFVLTDEAVREIFSLVIKGRSDFNFAPCEPFGPQDLNPRP
jgi:hypothetical protein